MSTKKLQAELEALVKKANDALTAAEDFATKHKLEFYFSPAYGMGGCFDGTSVPGEVDEYGDENYGWNPSSQSC